MQLESFAERIWALLLERDPSVLDSQPLTFTFTDSNEKDRKYTPDFKVWRRDGSIEIHEVTRTERQKQPRICERERGARIECEKNSWKYVVHTEQSLPQQTEVANLLALLPFRLESYAQEFVTMAVQEQLRQQSPQSLLHCFKQLAHNLSLSEPIVFGALCHLLWHRTIETDLHVLLIEQCTFSSKAMIWLHDEEEVQS